MNAEEWQAGIRGEVVPLKSKLIQGAELTLEHSQLTRPASPAAVLQRLLPSLPLPRRGGVCIGSLVVTVETDDAMKRD